MANLTPMMEQYFEIKKKHSHCLLFYRLGDFYELFYDDALIASKELEITLTGRDCGQESKAPMCGVPHHSVDGYIAKLVEKGYKVAICEQVEDAKKTKKLVKREVVRVITAGTTLDYSMLEEDQNNFLVCIYQCKNGFGIAYADITTGEFYTTWHDEGGENEIINELGRLSSKEIIVNQELTIKPTIERIFNVKPMVYSSWCFEHKNAYKKICSHFDVLNLSGLGLEDEPLSICASGALLEYLSETQKNTLNHILSIKRYSKNNYLHLDISARKSLELTENLRDKGKKNTLLWILDKTKTAMGARLLRKWIEQPLMNVEEIEKRLECVMEYKDEILIREEVKEYLNTIYDFERLISRIVYKTANARDLLNLKKSFQYFPQIKDILSKFNSQISKEMFSEFDILEDIYSLLENIICDEPPYSIREGGFIRDGYSDQLDTYRKAKTDGSAWLSELEARERESSGIKNLKIKYNKIFGFYIEITNSYLNLAPKNYIRRQTLANCERYTLPKLKEIEDAILGADEKIHEIEYTIFIETVEKLTNELQRIHFSAHIIAAVDVFQSLAEVADKNNYYMPNINTEGLIKIINGRHPVVEKTTNEPFISNDTHLDYHENMINIITGPNMSGKSTYMRQTALIAIMAQIGSFVPAELADISIIDKIFTRVGASDDLAMGQSTFMVEMSEVANILNNATRNSFVILDEIGRGTSTYDGVSIAWSVVEYIAGKICSKTLFATHYHELTDLEYKAEGIKNYCIPVQEKGKDIVFLRKIVRGCTDNSYGIHVAKLAGIPSVVLERSNEILAALNNSNIVKAHHNADSEESEVVSYSKKKPFDYSKHKIIINELATLDVKVLSPREAINKLYDLCEKSKVIK